MRLAAAFADVGRIVGDGDEAALGHRLGIEARRLFLHGAVRPANHECGMPLRAIDVLRDVEVGDQRDAEPVVEGDLPVIDAIALGEGLVPGERALREGRSVANRHHAERCDASAGQLQKVAPADIDARQCLTFWSSLRVVQILPTVDVRFSARVPVRFSLPTDAAGS